VRRWIALVALVALAACGGDEPKPIVGRLAPALLTDADLRGQITNGTIVSVSELAPYVDPDPRGPCGARVVALPLGDAVGVGVKSSNIGGVQLVARMKTSTAKAYFSQRKSDLREGCPEFRTRTPDGIQRVKLDRVVALDVSADDAISVQRATLLNGRVTSTTAIELRRGNVVDRLVLFAPAPLNEITVRTLARRMANRLASLSYS
jgi:hypothetical protein